MVMVYICVYTRVCMCSPQDCNFSNRKSLQFSQVAPLLSVPSSASVCVCVCVYWWIMDYTDEAMFHSILIYIGRSKTSCKCSYSKFNAKLEGIKYLRILEILVLHGGSKYLYLGVQQYYLEWAEINIQLCDPLIHFCTTDYNITINGL